MVVAVREEMSMKGEERRRNNEVGVEHAREQPVCQSVAHCVMRHSALKRRRLGAPSSQAL